MKEKSTTTSGEKPLALGVWWALWIVRAFAMLLNWSAIVVMVILSVTVLVMAGMENQPPWLFDVVLAGGGLLLLLGNVMLVFAAGIERAQRTSGDAVPQMSGEYGGGSCGMRSVMCATDFSEEWSPGAS